MARRKASTRTRDESIDSPTAWFAVLERARLIERVLPEDVAPRIFALLAHNYSLAGSPDDAIRLFGDLEAMADENFIDPAAWAYAYLAIRDQERALRWIEMAGVSWNNNPLNVMYLKANIFHDPLLDQPEFVAVRSRLGFGE